MNLSNLKVPAQVQSPVKSQAPAKKKFTLNLPGGKNITTDTNSIIILGSNGAGKSKLGAWIENNGPDKAKVHRISAQRSLTLPDRIPQVTFKQSLDNFLGITSTLRRGSTKKQDPETIRLSTRWNNAPTTTELSDFKEVLARLNALERKRDAEYVKQSKPKGKKELAPEVPPSAIDILKKIYKRIIPTPTIKFDEDHISVEKEAKRKRYWEDKEETFTQQYDAKDMSDGERQVLYLIGQCLCVPPQTFIIIDEPEIHLHKSIVSKLWYELEKALKDCLFIFITHDIDFALFHRYSQKIWMKKYTIDGKNELYDYDIIEASTDLQEEIIIQLAGPKKKCLIIEGDKHSLDSRLYSLIFPEYQIIPKGGCNSVSEAVKLSTDNPLLMTYDIVGIIDRDYREEKEIEELRTKRIFSLDYAEVENILLNEDVMRIVASHQMLDPQGTIDKVKEFIFQKMNDEIDTQINNAINRCIQRQLTRFLTPSGDTTVIKTALEAFIKEMKIEDAYNTIKGVFSNILDKRDYNLLLKHYNRKSILKQVSRFFNLGEDGYERITLSLISINKDNIISIIKNQLPKIETSETQSTK